MCQCDNLFYRIGTLLNIDLCTSELKLRMLPS